ncbi:hypothetical protein ESA94_01680 [Lacibacter luteus]|uniref:Glycosyl hydrolase family 30 TIM-barrel domain-containing protein n=1 Tax=Lacibacter luteus TaxID=2508719 RepID=A0A4V1M7W3_9BACT|nr:glycoside hydrolase family 30 beta sandwich domain-containing protein [Lacibacter luteus]RXK61752.1 hypothetical protein ESA94_01680 [Lacibacter luteus]
MKKKQNRLVWITVTMHVLLFMLVITACKKKGNPEPSPRPVVTLIAEVTISANQTYQTIDGFGCATVFRPSNASLTNDELDRLFGKANGQIGLNILRIRIAEDDYWRSLELANAKGAIQRGALVLATPWSPPSKFKTNKTLIGGSLIADSGAAYATYLNGFANYMSANGAPVYAVSVQNEPDIKVSYESCDWTAAEMLNFLKTHGHLISSTKLMAPESFNNNQTYSNTLLSDAGAAANIDLIGGHIYGSGITENALAKTLNKPVWMTEHLDTNYTHFASIGTAAEIHDCFTKANFSAYIWWYGKRFYGPIGEDGTVTKRGYIMSQFARFITPGSVRLGTGGNTQAEARVSAYRTSAGKRIIVVVNSYAAIVKQTINISNATVGDFIPYSTTETTNVAAGTKITATNNSFTYNLQPLSVTTFVEQ